MSRGVPAARRRRALLLTAACALGARLWWAAGAPAERSPDGKEYHAYAASLLDEGRYAGAEGRRATRSPGYPLFLAAAYSAGGRSLAAVRAAQALLGAATCVLLFLLGERLLGPPWGPACGLAAAFYRGLAEPAALDTPEGLYGFLLAAAAWLLLAGPSAPGRRAAGAGAALGAAALTRPESLPLAAALLAAADRFAPGFRARQRWTALGVFCLLVGLWAGRNQAVLGKPLPTSSRGAFNLYAGLHLPLERAGRAAPPLHDPRAEALPEPEGDRVYAGKFKELWRRTGWGDRLRAWSFNLLSVLYPFLPEYDVTFMLLAPFWAWALWARRGERRWWALSGPVLYSLAVYSLFGGPVSRYRQAIAPYLVLLAAGGLADLRRRLRPRAFLGVSAGWAGANVIAWALGPRLRQAALWARDALW